MKMNWRMIMSDIIYYVIFLFIPWLIGCVIILYIVIEIFLSWLWFGMDEEKRYEWIKIAKW